MEPPTQPEREVLTWDRFGEAARSVVDPDLVWRRTDRWIDFPWSTLPTVTA